MRLDPTVISRVGLFELTLNNYYKTPLFKDDGDVLSFYEKAWEYINHLPAKEKEWFAFQTHDRDTDVQCFEVVVTDNDAAQSLWLYNFPFEKNYKRFKVTLTQDELNKKIRDL